MKQLEKSQDFLQMSDDLKRQEVEKMTKATRIQIYD